MCGVRCECETMHPPSPLSLSKPRQLRALRTLLHASDLVCGLTRAAARAATRSRLGGQPWPPAPPRKTGRRAHNALGTGAKRLNRCTCFGSAAPIGAGLGRKRENETPQPARLAKLRMSCASSRLFASDSSTRPAAQSNNAQINVATFAPCRRRRRTRTRTRSQHTQHRPRTRACGNVPLDR